MSGADLAAVQRILRHSDPKLTTEVYAHLAPEYLRAEVDRLSFGAAVLETVPGARGPFDSAPASQALPSGRTEDEGTGRTGEDEGPGFVTRLLPAPAPKKTKAGTRGDQASGFRPSKMERETGFEPATLSLGKRRGGTAAHRSKPQVAETTGSRDRSLPHRTHRAAGKRPLLADTLADKTVQVSGPRGGTPLLSVREVAARLHVSSATVYALCRAGHLEHHRVSNAIRISERELAEYVDATTRTAP